MYLAPSILIILFWPGYLHVLALVFPVVLVLYISISQYNYEKYYVNLYTQYPEFFHSLLPKEYLLTIKKIETIMANVQKRLKTKHRISVGYEQKCAQITFIGINYGRKSAVININPEKIKKYNSQELMFFIAHELAHLKISGNFSISANKNLGLFFYISVVISAAILFINSELLPHTDLLYYSVVTIFSLLVLHPIISGSLHTYIELFADQIATNLGDDFAKGGISFFSRNTNPLYIETVLYNLVKSNHPPDKVRLKLIKSRLK